MYSIATVTIIIIFTICTINTMAQINFDNIRNNNNNNNNNINYSNKIKPSIINNQPSNINAQMYGDGSSRGGKLEGSVGVGVSVGINDRVSINGGIGRRGSLGDVKESTGINHGNVGFKFRF